MERKRYATAEIPGSHQVAIVGGVGDNKKLDSSVLLLKSFPATISTDKVEYLPGTAPVIRGSGWQPFEKITIVRQKANLGHQRRRLQAVADKRGEFICTELTAADYRVWVTYTLTAQGESSEQMAQTSYIDAPLPGKELESLGRVHVKFPLTTPAGTTYSFAVTNGNLPPGLSLSSNGTLSGTPTAAGNYSFAVTATGWGSCSTIKGYNLLVTATCAAISLNPATLPNGTAGTGYTRRSRRAAAPGRIASPSPAARCLLSCRSIAQPACSAAHQRRAARSALQSRPWARAVAPVRKVTR